jgi:hypothetical protein
MKHADVFIYLDDVPLPQGRSFQTRIAIKTAQGRRWLTVPVHRESGQLIKDVRIVNDGWQPKHLKTLQQELPSANHVVADLYTNEWTRLVDFNIALTNRIATHFNIDRSPQRSSDIRAEGSGYRKIMNLCRAVGATQYITAHGARNYFDHESFDRAGIEVIYLDYDLSPYAQPHGSFDPYVTALDVIAHAPNPLDYIDAALVSWRDFIARESALHDTSPLSVEVFDS